MADITRFRFVPKPDVYCCGLIEKRFGELVEDTVCFSVAIIACARGIQWKRALYLLEEMQQHRVKPAVTAREASAPPSDVDAQEAVIAEASAPAIDVVAKYAVTARSPCTCG